MSKCRKCHLRETKFAKFPGGACPQTPLEARAVGARLSAFGAKRASLFLLKRGWNVCTQCRYTLFYFLVFIKTMWFLKFYISSFFRVQGGGFTSQYAPEGWGFVKICNGVKSNPHLGPGWGGSGFQLISAL